MIENSTTVSGCFGFCSECGRRHHLPEGSAREYCYELIEILDNERRIDFSNPLDKADPRFSTDYLFGAARGQMFGVLVCEDSDGNRVVLRAYSGQYNGVWEVEGWVPPLLSVDEFEELNNETEPTIKRLSQEINLLPEDSSERKEMIAVRKTLSQELMVDIHGLYKLTNFAEETRSLYDVFLGDGGIPTGTGDCCGPKLLNYAAINGLQPIGLAEFYYGRENRSESRLHKRFYPSCNDKCQPILGFLLCGAGDVR